MFFSVDTVLSEINWYMYLVWPWISFQTAMFNCNYIQINEKCIYNYKSKKLGSLNTC